MPFSQVFFWAVPIIALVCYCVIMLFLILAQKDKYIRAFMPFLIALIIWGACSLFMKLQLYPGALFWNKIMIAGTVAAPFLLYYFVSIFVGSVNIITTILWGITTSVAIIISLLGLVVTDVNIITQVVSVNGRDFNAIGLNYTLGVMAIPVYLLMFIITASILVKVRMSIKNGDITPERISLIAIGIGIMFLGACTNISVTLGKYPFDILTCLINAILILISIYKYRMLELRFIVTRGLVYSVFAALITIAYIYTVFIIERQTGDLYRSVIPYFTAFTALLVAFIFQPLYKLISKLVDRMFYKSEYIRRQALRNFSAVISNNLDLNSIAEELIESVQLAIRAKHVLILTKYEDQGDYCVFQTSSQIFKPDLVISVDNPIISWFESNHSSLSRDALYSLPFFKSMWEKEKRELYDLDIEVIVPIKSRNEIIGMIMLTRKDNNTAYTMDDLDLLSYLGASTAVAFDNARLYTRSQAEALTDSLTKLHNHRYFYKALSEQMAKIGSSELSILMIDLDLFKLFNDLYGHVEGDKALEMIASILMRNVGQKGIVCRYGGEEFTVILPYHDTKMAYDLAEKIRIDIEKTFFSANDVTQRFLTASIGVCTYPHAAPNGEELLKRADIAMYTAKNSGKNKTVIYTPETTTVETSEGYTRDLINSRPNFAATIYALTAAIDAKDHYTFGHSQKVAEYATILASKLSLDKSHIEIIKEAALLHDIGKIGIPEHILTKTGRLTNEEYNIVKQHVEMSITIIKHLPSLNHVIPAVIGHHERWDGKGYPRGLKGENIPLSARCLAITDAFDAMTSHRPYRTCLSVNAALTEIENNIGTQFDPMLANIFIKLVHDGDIVVDQSKQKIKSVS